MTKPQEIITDEEIERVHSNANFGSCTKRDVVNQSLLKAACGYTSGTTATHIIAEHGLITAPGRRGKSALTMRGRKYLYSVFGEGNF